MHETVGAHYIEAAYSELVQGGVVHAPVQEGPALSVASPGRGHIAGILVKAHVIHVREHTNQITGATSHVKHAVAGPGADVVSSVDQALLGAPHHAPQEADRCGRGQDLAWIQ